MLKVNFCTSSDFNALCVSLSTNNLSLGFGMKKIHQLIIGAVALGLTSIAAAQSAPATTGDGAKKSSDPFIERRNEKAQAKSDYKSNKISKDELKKEKQAANKELKASGAQAPIEGNIDLNPPGGAKK
ncbi:hypothetical protein D3870_12220 [Noviherbaspirillum cavernae]|uniref:Uncharacterized protein n=1 Tax=Noviherbaspirillum cavernae TaxID=2320862 RepID=A0A418X2I2_9BURK|nr:hypothetical protein [Noviherbaspirillum cavernae]RJG06672.1 hypothetical protein D3870_12220 [Noviherbaspirillum cavernae]